MNPPTWNFPRVATQAAAGGISSELQGGKFEEGLKLSLLTSAVRLGFETARQYTDTSSLSGSGRHEYDRFGELRTDGIRRTVYAPGYDASENNWFTRLEMAPEGTSAHFYDANSLVGRFVNQVSKVHDFQNSFGYEGGNYVSRSAFYNTAFQVYNAVGIIPAAAYTSIALQPGPAASYIEQSGRQRRDDNR